MMNRCCWWNADCQRALRQQSQSKPIYLVTMTLLNVPAIVFLIHEYASHMFLQIHCRSPYLWHDWSPVVIIAFIYLLLFCNSSLLMAVFRDPGRLPRGADPTPDVQRLADGTAGNAGLEVVQPREIMVRGEVVLVRYCCTPYDPLIDHQRHVQHVSAATGLSL
jgi:hypothetical protein